jgi:predicted PurR-regulated permease PerM
MIKLNDSAKLFFSIGSIMLLVISMYYLRPLLAPLSFSFILAVVLLPPTAYLERRGLAPFLAAFLTVLFTTVLVVGLIVAATWEVSLLSDNSTKLITKMETRINQGIAGVTQALPQLKQQKIINYKLRTGDLLKKVAEKIGNSASGLVDFVATALLMPLFVFFLLCYRQFFRKFLHRVIDRENKQVDQVLHKIYQVTRSYLAGMVMVMAIVGVLNTIGLLIIGVPYGVFFAIVASLLMVVPYIGVFIGSLLPCIMALVTFNSPWPAMAVIAWMGVVQMLEGNFISPNLMGSKVSINPFAAIISLILMGQLWGIAGLALAIPFVAILKIILDAIPETEPYGMLLGEVQHEVKNKDKPGKKAKLDKIAV